MTKNKNKYLLAFFLSFVCMGANTIHAASCWPGKIISEKESKREKIGTEIINGSKFNKYEVTVEITKEMPSMLSCLFGKTYKETRIIAEPLSVCDRLMDAHVPAAFVAGIVSYGLASLKDTSCTYQSGFDFSCAVPKGNGS